MANSRLETQFDYIMRVLGSDLPTPVAEYRFAAPRKWRFDRAWVAHKVAVELEGGVWTRGRHVRPAGFLADIEKYNHAAASGWRVLRYTADTLDDDPLAVVTQIARALRLPEAAL